MKTREFAEQIEHLLWTGAIEGHQVLSLYYLLQSYQQGTMSGAAMQDAIDQCDPEQIEKVLNEHFPSPYE